MTERCESAALLHVCLLYGHSSNSAVVVANAAVAVASCRGGIDLIAS